MRKELLFLSFSSGSGCRFCVDCSQCCCSSYCQTWSVFVPAAVANFVLESISGSFDGTYGAAATEDANAGRFAVTAILSMATFVTVSIVVEHVAVIATGDSSIFVTLLFAMHFLFFHISCVWRAGPICCNRFSCCRRYRRYRCFSCCKRFR